MRTRVILPVALVAIGLVWIGQGIGVLRGSSFMIDDPLWAVIGVVMVVGGVVLGLSAARTRPPT